MVATEQKAQDKHDQAQENNGPSQLLATAALGVALFAGELASQYLFSKSSPDSEVQVAEPIDSTDSLAAPEMPVRR
jgi:hypothetical protein